MSTNLANRPIGIFDSGVGGLTVAKEVIHLLPFENLIYVGDTKRVPYGTRDLKEVKQFAFEIINFLVTQDVKLVVIACNTATAAALTAAQQRFNLPIIGVIEPGARAAVQATRYRRIGVIGTAATINSQAYVKAIHALDAGITVFSAACPKFVEIVEQGMVSEANFFRPKTYNLAKGYLTPLLRAGIDSLILGCTHYPLLQELLQKVVGQDIVLISSAQETALEVKQLLERKGQLRQERSLPEYKFFATGDPEQFAFLGSRFLDRKIAEVNFLPLERMFSYPKL